MSRSALRTLRLALWVALLVGAGVDVAAQQSAGRPTIQLSLPRDFDGYTTEVIVQGEIRDNQAGRASVIGIRRAWWDVLGTSLGGEVPLDAQGRFTFSFTAPAGRVGVFLKLHAEGRNGLVTTESVALLRKRADLDLALDTPRDGDYYREELGIQGRVTGSVADVETLAWHIGGMTHRIEIAADGSFTAPIDTRGLRSEATLRVTLVARDGRTVERTTRLRDGLCVPVVSLEAPGEGEEYGESVELRGTVTSDGAGSLSWRLRGTDLGAPLPLGPDGAFSTLITTGAAWGGITIDLLARGENGRESARSVTLREAPREVQLEVSSPLDRGTYEDEIVISGRAGTPGRLAWSTTWIDSLVYTLAGATSLAGRIVPDPKTGTFVHRIPARELPGAVMLRIVLRDLEGKETERLLTLTQKRLPVVAARPAPPAQDAADATPSRAADPVLVLHAPNGNAVYKGTLPIAGLVSDGLEQRTAAARFPSLEWELVGTGRRAAITAASNGAFSVAAATEGLRGTYLLLVSAVHENGERLSQTLAVRDDGTGPWLRVDRPASGDHYEDTILLEGVARDTADDPRSVVEVAALRYEIVGRPEAAGELSVDRESGAFRTEIPTVGFQGRQTLAVVATDLNGFRSIRNLVLQDGRAVPVVSLEAPSPGAEYGAYLEVRGRVSLSGEADAESIAAVEVSVASSTYELGSTALRTTLAVGMDGAFEIALPARELRGNQKVTVVARAHNGKSAEASTIVSQSSSGIPGFAASGTDGSARLSWPRLPLATRYDVTMTVDAVTQSLESVKSPLEVTGLSNGTRYGFTLRAQLSTGEVIASSEMTVIPLAPRTLQPQVRGEFRRIRVWWPRIPGADAYEVWRSAEGGLEPARVTTTTELSYLDAGVDFGREYSYRVRPAKYAGTLSDPASARTTAFPAERFALESATPVDGGALAVAVDRNYAYLACGESGLVVIEVRDAAHPAVLATVELADARDVALATLGDGKRYALVADAERGLVVVDVSTAGQPVAVGNRTTADARAVAVISDRQSRLAYLADGDSGLKVIDLSTPKRPERLASLPAGNLRALALRRPYLYAAGDAGLTIYDVSNPVAPVQVSQTPLTGCRGIATELRGGSLYLYIARGTGGLTIVEATDPQRVRTVGEYDTTFASAVSASTHVYVADGAGGILVVDVSDPGAPVPFDAVEMGDTRDVAIQETAGGEQYAYAACEDGLRIVQILVHGRSLELGSFPTGDRGYDLTIAPLGSGALYASVADHARGVHLFRLEGVGSPDFRGSGLRIPTTYAWSTAVIRVGDRWCILVADGEGGLKVFDLTETEGQSAALRARRVGAIYASDARSVSVYESASGDPLALVADRRNGLRVLTISPPERVQQLALLSARETVDVAVAVPEGGSPVALVASGEGVLVVDLANAEAPTVTGTIATLMATRLAVLDPDRLLFAVISQAGVHLIDCSSPSAPRLLATYATAFAEDLFAPRGDSGAGRLYVAEGHRGVSVLDTAGPTSLRTVSSCPGVFAVGVSGWQGEDGQPYAYAVDTARVWQISILVPRWLACEP